MQVHGKCMLCRVFWSQANPSAGGHPGRPASRGRKDLTGEATAGRPQGALCPAEGRRLPPPSSQPLRALTLEINEEAAPGSSWKILEVSFDSLFPGSSPQAPSSGFQLQNKSHLPSCLCPQPLPCHIVPTVQSTYRLQSVGSHVL